MAKISIADLIEYVELEGELTRGSKGDEFSIKTVLKSLGELITVNKSINSAITSLLDLNRKWQEQEEFRYRQQEDTEREQSSGPVEPKNVASVVKPAAVGAGGVPGPLGGLLGAIGGLLGGVGAAAMGGGLMVLGPGLTALSVGLAAFANPVTIAGGAALLGFLGGLGGVAWLAGKGAQEIGKGFQDISDGIDRLDETGQNINIDNLIAAGDGLKKFLENVGSVKSVFGAIVTFLTGDLPNIADGMNKLNTIDIDKEKMKQAGEGLNAFMSAMGEGSFFGKLMGSISSAIAPDMESLANGFSKLSDVSKTFDLAKFQDMSKGMVSITDPLAEFSKSGVLANFVGKNALTDIAEGVTALNKTEVDRLSQVAEGFKTIKDPLLSITGIGLAANFVGKGAMTDLTDAASDMNTRLGSDEALSKAIIVSKVFGELSSGLSKWTGATFLESLSGVGKSILNFISGEESPITGVLKLAEKSSDLVSVSNSLKKIGEALSSFANIKFDTNNLDLKGLAEKLGNAIPLFQGLVNGGKVSTGLFGSIDFGKGLLDPGLKLNEAVQAIDKVQRILGFQPATAGSQINTGTTENQATRDSRSGGSPIIAPSTNNNVTNQNVTNRTTYQAPAPQPRSSEPAWGSMGSYQMQ